MKDYAPQRELHALARPVKRGIGASSHAPHPNVIRWLIGIAIAAALALWLVPEVRPAFVPNANRPLPTPYCGYGSMDGFSQCADPVTGLLIEIDRN